MESLFWEPILSENNQNLKFSVIVPVFNTPAELLCSSVNSVISQIYGNWELILVDDASTARETVSVLSGCANLDPRINVVRHSVNRHISVATNTGLRIANGKFVVFLDHDDLLSPHALNELAIAVSANPEVKWIYSDEDLIDKKGIRIKPHFKCKWNLYLLRAHNYITHLCCYDRQLLLNLGGCREGFEGAQDYDLALRAANKLSNSQITHIPKILYHWRMHGGSTALSSTAKPYTVEAGYKALLEHLMFASVSARVQCGSTQNFYHVSYDVTAPAPLISIIIPTRDQVTILRQCIDSVIECTEYKNFEIVVVDNDSKDSATLEYLSQIESLVQVKVIKYEAPFNYSKINNFAVKQCMGEYVLLLNNDTKVISSNWLGDMLGIASQPGVGCVGAKLLYADNTIQHAGVILGLGGYAAHSHRGLHVSDNGYFNRPHCNQQVSAVTAACLLVKKDIYNEVQGLDESFSVAYNDVDFCLRVQALRYDNVYCASAILYHYESKSRGHDLSAEKQKRFEKEKALLLSRWDSVIQNDPFYSPHLTRHSEDFQISRVS